MDIETMKQNVIQVSQTFYNTQDKEQRRVAEDWLNNFKKSIDAWTVTDQILHTSKSEQVLFFAAQTIRSKIQYSFHELPHDYHEVISTTLISSLLPDDQIFFYYLFFFILFKILPILKVVKFNFFKDFKDLKNLTQKKILINFFYY